MIVEATFAMIMAVGLRPTSQERGWIKSGTSVSLSPSGESTDRQMILDPGEVWRETEGSFIQASNVAMSRLDWIDAQIESYSCLEEGWDGPDSEPPKAAHIHAARSILHVLPAGTPIPKPMLASSGELGFYWEEADWMADIAIEGDNEFSLFFRSRDKTVEILKQGLAIGPQSSAIIKETLTAA